MDRVMPTNVRKDNVREEKSTGISATNGSAEQYNSSAGDSSALAGDSSTIGYF